MFSWLNRNIDILTMLINGQELLKVKKKDLPFQNEIRLKLEKNSDIIFKDSLGNRSKYTNFHISGDAIFTIALHNNFACQVDCIVSKDTKTSEFNLSDTGVQGIRFQPFYIPQNKDMFNKSWEGLGLYARGLHYQGMMTPKNVFLCAKCHECRENFLFDSIHTGIIESQYMYSASGKYTLLHSARKDISNSAIPLAPDDSDFKELNSFRCPHCSSEYIKFNSLEEKKSEHYANFHYGFEMDTSQVSKKFERRS